MPLSYNKTIGLPVITIKTGEKLCKVKDFVIDYQNGKFLGILGLRAGFLFSAKFFVRAENIKKFGENAVMVENATVLENPYQNAKVANLIKEKIKIKDNKVLTESGSDLGEVRNHEVDLISGKLAKIIVSGGIFRDLFRGEIIIPSTQIVSIGRHAIIVKDAVIKEIESIPTKISAKKELSTATMCVKKDARF